jgi:regulator of sigma E protease
MELMMFEIPMLVYIIPVGILGLGIVVFVHELGHFIAARLMKIDVEAFSIGWGKPILKKKVGTVEYRLGLFPMGGYCKMKGDSSYEELYEKNKEGIPAEKGTYFAAHPYRRIVACAGGPLFNLVFAILVLSVIWGRGFEINALDNRIILVSDIVPGSFNPADEAGLRTGDRIIELNGIRTETSRDIQEIVFLNPDKLLPMQVERDGQINNLSVRPRMTGTGAGMIGIHFWIDPIIESVIAGSQAEFVGLRSGDKIIRVNGTELPHTMAFSMILENRPQVLTIEYMRESRIFTTELIPVYNEAGSVNLGISWEIIRYRTPSLSPPLAFAKGVSETLKTFGRMVASLSLLFRGVDLTQAVTGPVGITYMVGEAAVDGFRESFGTGLSSLASILSLISIALCMMNLLPLPILDGGMILLYLVEGIRKKLFHPKFMTVFTNAGFVLIVGLIIFALFGDILRIVNR